jgi:hypothetical protein
LCSAGDGKHRQGCRASTFAEALICPAYRVWRKDDVVERDERMCRRERLLVEDVQRRTRDVLFGERSDERPLVDDRAARNVDQVRGRLHKGELLRVKQPRVSGASGHATQTKSERVRSSSRTTSSARSHRGTFAGSS